MKCRSSSPGASYFVTVKVRSAIVHSSTLEPSPGVAFAVGFTGLDGLTEFDEACSVVELGSVAVGLADVVALRWSEGLAPSALSPPHAAVVRSAATTPAPRTYLFQLPEPLRLPETATFTEVPLVQRTKSE
jgi:hypothetical protein